MNSVRSLRGVAPTIGERVYIDPQSCIIGDVEIGADSSVWPMAVIRGDMHRIRIGERVSVQDGSVLHITHASTYNEQGHPLIIGNDVTIGHNACLHGCTIEDEVLIGIGAIVLDGALVPTQTMIAAGCLVPPGKQLESGHLYVGSPAKKARPLNDKELAFFKYSASNYVKEKNQFLEEL